MNRASSCKTGICSNLKNPYFDGKCDCKRRLTLNHDERVRCSSCWDEYDMFDKNNPRCTNCPKISYSVFVPEEYPPIARRFNQPTTLNTFTPNPEFSVTGNGLTPYTIVETIRVSPDKPIHVNHFRRLSSSDGPSRSKKPKYVSTTVTIQAPGDISTLTPTQLSKWNESTSLYESYQLPNEFFRSTKDFKSIDSDAFDVHTRASVAPFSFFPKRHEPTTEHTYLKNEIKRLQNKIKLLPKQSTDRTDILSEIQSIRKLIKPLNEHIKNKVRPFQEEAHTNILSIVNKSDNAKKIKELKLKEAKLLNTLKQTKFSSINRKKINEIKKEIAKNQKALSSLNTFSYGTKSYSPEYSYDTEKSYTPQRTPHTVRNKISKEIESLENKLSTLKLTEYSQRASILSEIMKKQREKNINLHNQTSNTWKNSFATITPTNSKHQFYKIDQDIFKGHSKKNKTSFNESFTPTRQSYAHTNSRPSMISTPIITSQYLNYTEEDLFYSSFMQFRKYVIDYARFVVSELADKLEKKRKLDQYSYSEIVSKIDQLNYKHIKEYVQNLPKNVEVYVKEYTNYNEKTKKSLRKFFEREIKKTEEEIDAYKENILNSLLDNEKLYKRVNQNSLLKIKNTRTSKYLKPETLDKYKKYRKSKSVKPITLDKNKRTLT